ncbi:hypothetical protein [Mesorhizobium loti]|uniref:hypothetical protein n=1 Tax=Rhizobium loti TaxID=381 RepID=UPI001267D8FE|nr:hypothetical protein [Mesorhizobium loti]
MLNRVINEGCRDNRITDALDREHFALRVYHVQLGREIARCLESRIVAHERSRPRRDDPPK